MCLCYEILLSCHNKNNFFRNKKFPRGRWLSFPLFNLNEWNEGENWSIVNVFCELLQIIWYFFYEQNFIFTTRRLSRTDVNVFNAKIRMPIYCQFIMRKELATFVTNRFSSTNNKVIHNTAIGKTTSLLWVLIRLVIIQHFPRPWTMAQKLILRSGTFSHYSFA